jgi:hypothetical protein
MRPTICLLICSLIFFTLYSCNKQSAIPTGPAFNPYGPAGANPQGTAETIASVSFVVNGNPLPVTSIAYDRAGTSTGTFNFSVWNALQRVDVYCFSFNEQSGFNYQFSDSINYSTRPDSLSEWSTVGAVNSGTVTFDCCAAPLTDTIIAGGYSANFASANPVPAANADIVQPLTVNGKFNLLFDANHSCH